MPAEELIVEVGKLGFKHLVYTDISRDGMRTGIDANRYVEVARVFGHPVIASGGVACLLYTSRQFRYSRNLRAGRRHA